MATLTGYHKRKLTMGTHVDGVQDRQDTEKLSRHQRLLEEPAKTIWQMVHGWPRLLRIVPRADIIHLHKQASKSPLSV